MIEGPSPLTYLLFPQLKSHKTRKFEVEYYFTINVVSQGLSLSESVHSELNNTG